MKKVVFLMLVAGLVSSKVSFADSVDREISTAFQEGFKAGKENAEIMDYRIKNDVGMDEKEKAYLEGLMAGYEETTARLENEGNEES